MHLRGRAPLLKVLVTLTGENANQLLQAAFEVQLAIAKRLGGAVVARSPGAQRGFADNSILMLSPARNGSRIPWPRALSQKIQPQAGRDR